VGLIGEGRHQRAIIDVERFLRKLMQKTADKADLQVLRSPPDSGHPFISRNGPSGKLGAVHRKTRTCPLFRVASSQRSLASP
jgi:hypothetical protein